MIAQSRDLEQIQSHSNTIVSDVDGKESIQSLLESTEPTKKLVPLIPEDVINQVAGMFKTVPNQMEGEGK